MAKKMKKILSMILAACSLGAIPMMSGCGGGEKIEFSEDTLYVASINKGYGTAWLDALLTDFCSTKPGLSYELTPVYSDKEILNKVEAGAGYCNYDLIFTGAIKPAATRFLANLEDVYNSTYESGSRAGKTVAESMEKTILASMTERKDDSSYTCMPWTAQISGLLLNYTQLDKTLGDGWENTYKLRTTNELLAFCEVLKSKGLSPFVHCADTNQYGNMYKAWFAQYNGVQGVEDYYNARYVNELGESGVGPEVCKNEGVLEALKVAEDIFMPEDGEKVKYSHEKSNGITWEASQSFFMAGKSGMFHNGDWFATEMGKAYPDVDLQIIKTPMISALGTKLGITEEQYIQLIDYVDAVNAGETPVKPTITSAQYNADELIEKVTEARSWVSSNAEFFTTAVVDYNKKDLAKEFLKYMVSDRGQNVYATATKGLTMAYGYDLEESDGFATFPNFAKSRWKVIKNARYNMDTITTKYGAAGLEPFKIMAEAPIGVWLSKKLKNAQQIYEYDYTYHSEKWSIYEQFGN